MLIDTSFDFRVDARGKDPDSHSPTLRKYHKRLWSRTLPGGVLPDTQDEHDGVTHHEHLDTGVPGTLACGDARGVAGMLTPAALLAVASVMWQAWLP
jgi:hypothetical protein